MVRITHLPDLHIGHPRVKATHVKENLIKYLYPVLREETDILIIGGDFFDNLLNFNSESGYVAASIIQDLKYLATHNNFIIRVLRGTFTHDRRQNQFFNIDATSPDIVKLYDTIAIEHIDKYNITILYIPDDLPHEDVSYAAKKLVNDSGYDKVDFIITHGYYDHLLPPFIPSKPANTYTDNTFDDIVHGVILNGHIHTPRIHGKVITGGSFERLNHGEEEPKGFFKIEYDKDTHLVKYNFIENKSSSIFKTIDLTNVTRDEIVEKFTPWVESLLANDTSLGDVYIRVISNVIEIRQAIANIVHDKCKRIHVTYKKNISEVNKVVDRFTIDDLPIITEDNLSEYVYNNLLKKNIQLSLEDITLIINR